MPQNHFIYTICTTHTQMGGISEGIAPNFSGIKENRFDLNFGFWSTWKQRFETYSMSHTKYLGLDLDHRVWLVGPE